MGRGRGIKRQSINRPFADKAGARLDGPRSKTVVVGDIHGNPQLLHDLLLSAGAIDDKGERIPGVRALGLGDIINGTMDSEEGDIACLKDAERWLEHSLIGNHEAALLGLTVFDGMWAGGPVPSAVRSLTFKGFFLPALLEGNTLLVHGGIPPGLAKENAEETYRAIYAAWGKNPHSDFFNAVSSPKRTHYPAEEGGIFWLDWEEERAEHISQIAGHTPLAEPELLDKGRTFHLNLDIRGHSKGRGAAAVLIDGEPIEIISLDPNE